MATEEPSAAVTSENAGDPMVAEPPAVQKIPNVEAADDSGKEKKEKKPRKPRGAPSHPPYLEMIGEAITTLKERTGSSQYAIGKFIEDKHKNKLPPNFKKLLLVQLRKLTASGKLMKIKNSYKLPTTSKHVAAAASANPKLESKAKPTAVATPKRKAADKMGKKGSVAKKKKLAAPVVRKRRSVKSIGKRARN